jgi:acyl-CoA reductase-like NAD-dependent aldehyde dehydrogenase
MPLPTRIWQLDAVARYTLQINKLCFLFCEELFRSYNFFFIMSNDRIQRLQESVIDGRTENVRYRQNQLQALHLALRNNADRICNAIAKDAQVQSSNAEVEVEYYLSTNAVKHFYESLQFEASIKDEYAVANGLDNARRRVGYGLVIIRPTTHTRLYSAICPLAAALAAGNSVIVEV